MLPSLGAFGDDPEKFFRRSLFDVSPGDLWRWTACRDVLREAAAQHRKRDDNV